MPTQASAKLDFRCPPNLEPVDQLKLLEAHLERHGFDDIEIEARTPNENMPVERNLQGIKFAATIFQEFADRT